MSVSVELDLSTNATLDKGEYQEAWKNNDNG